jgi:hypothetical protein
MKKTKIVVLVSGGNVQGILSSSKNIDVTVFDDDNLQAEGKNIFEIDEAYNKLTKGMKAVLCL